MNVYYTTVSHPSIIAFYPSNAATDSFSDDIRPEKYVLPRSLASLLPSADNRLERLRPFRDLARSPLTVAVAEVEAKLISDISDMDFMDDVTTFVMSPPLRMLTSSLKPTSSPSAIFLLRLFSSI